MAGAFGAQNEEVISCGRGHINAQVMQGNMCTLSNNSGAAVSHVCEPLVVCREASRFCICIHFVNGAASHYTFIEVRDSRLSGYSMLEEIIVCNSQRLEGLLIS